MPDIAHTFGSDLSVSATGDLALSSGPQLTQDRLLRRFLTNPAGYIWHLAYGAGLGQFIGQPANAPRIQGVMRAQALKEATVAVAPAPTVTVAAQVDGTTIATVTYADAPSGLPQVLNVPVA
jgi:hypothetical protein